MVLKDIRGRVALFRVYRVGRQEIELDGSWWTMLRVTTQWGGVAGSPYYSTMYFAGTEALEAESAVDAVAVFWNAIGDRIQSACDGTIQPEVFVLDPVNGDTTGVHVTTPNAIATTLVSGQLASATQGLVRWTTGVYEDSRQIRGRTFIPAPTEQDSDVGAPLTAYINDVSAAAAVLAADPGFGVWRRPRPETSPLGQRDGQFALATGGACWSQWAVLRSRRD